MVIIWKKNGLGIALLGIGAAAAVYSLFALAGMKAWGAAIGTFIGGLVVALLGFISEGGDHLFFLPMWLWGGGGLVAGLYLMVVAARQPGFTKTAFTLAPPSAQGPVLPDALVPPAPAPPTPGIRPPEPRRRVFSDDSAAEWLEEQLAGGKACSSECVINGMEAWTGSMGCIPEETERIFLSRDCRRLIALSTASIEGEAWREIPLAAVYEKGMKVGSVVAGSVFKTKPPDGVWFSSPEYTPDGKAVTVKLSDGKDFKLVFKSLKLRH